MSDDNQQQAANQSPLTINGQYIKDLSFEVPHAPQVFFEMGTQTPDVPISIDIQARGLQDNIYEVVLHLKVESRYGEKPGFILEMAYGGVFTVNVPPEHLEPMLLIECPRMLFPFARGTVASVTRDGGFPPLMLQPIDFVALFRQRQAETQSA